MGFSSGGFSLGREGVPPPASPFGKGGGKVVSAEVARLYYSAYTAWLSALAVAGQDSASESSDVFGPVVLDEPKTDVSVGSSASTGRAARRARWRARKAARTSGGSGGVSLSGTEPSAVSAALPGAGRREIDGGGDNSDVSFSARTFTMPATALSGPATCYRLALRGECEEEAIAVLGENPTFSAILASPSCWFLQELSCVFVSRVGASAFHAASSGRVSLQDCFSAMVQAGRVVPESGMLSGRPEFLRAELDPILVRKAPLGSDVCGGVGSCGIPLGKGCLPCSVAAAYESGVGSWKAEFRDVSSQQFGDVSVATEVDVAGGGELVVADLGSEAAVLPASVTCELNRVEIIFALGECREHRVMLGQCGCSAVHSRSPSVAVHCVDLSSIPVETCGFRCGRRKVGFFEKAAVAARTFCSLGKPVQPVRYERPAVLDGLGAYRALGGFSAVGRSGAF